MSKSRSKDLASLRTYSELSRQQRIARLIAEMQDHIAAGKALNMSRPPHIEITEALHTLVFQDQPEAWLKVEYGDGSYGKDFPVCRLWEPQGGWDFQPRQSRHLQIGTLSLRHVEYDYYVDVYLIRDKATRHLSQKGVDDLAYRSMKELLDAPQLRGEFYLTIFQAGLEPLAVGMYRALTEHLIQRNMEGWGPLRVRPVFHFKHDGEPDAGSIWGAGFDQES